MFSNRKFILLLLVAGLVALIGVQWLSIETVNTLTVLDDREGLRNFDLQTIARAEGLRTYWLQLSFAGASVGIGLTALAVGFLFRENKRHDTLRRAFQDLYDHAPCGYHSLNADGIFTNINETEAAWLGFSRAELIGKSRFTDLLDDESKTVFAQKFLLLKQKGQINDLQLRMKRQNGSHFDALINASAVFDTEGRFVQTRTTVLDFSERKKLETDLLAARRVAEQNARLKEQFMANMSHEIRTPMNAILGFANRLRRAALGPTDREAVEAIATGGENLLTILNDILDFSKIEAGMLRVESVAFDLKGLAESLKMLFQPKMQEKRLDFRVKVADDIPDRLLGDPTRLTQILVNLLGNALKFTANGSIELSISTKNDGSNRYVFSVADTGIGIPNDRLTTIFDRFRQAEEDTTRLYGGTGLGLSITKQLVELLGGKIEVASTVGEGSAFRFELPFQKTAEAFEAQSLENQRLKAAALPKFTAAEAAKIRVLLVEDNLANQRLTSLLLEDWGVRFDLAENGEIALEKLKAAVADPFSLILMDIQMPKMDGYTAAQAIRHDLKLDTPIIAMTAHAFAGEREKCLAFGMNDYTPKPVKEAELRRLIAFFSNNDNQTLNPTNKISIEQKTTGGADFGKTIRLEKLMELSGDQLEFAHEMVAIFKKSAPDELAQMHQFLEKNDRSALKKQVHSMKSTAGYAGFSDDAMAALERLEQLAAASDCSETELQNAAQRVEYFYENGLAEAENWQAE